MPADLWTAEDVELVAKIHAAAWGLDPRASDREIARQTLAALAEAGRIREPGDGEEWAVRVDKPMPQRYERAGDIITHFGSVKARRAREFWDGWTPVRRWVGPWQPASDLLPATPNLAATPGLPVQPEPAPKEATDA